MRPPRIAPSASPSFLHRAPIVKPYEPTPHEQAAMDAYRARKKGKPLAPRMKVSEKDGVTKVAPDHPDPAAAGIRLLEAFGTRDDDFLKGILTQLALVGSKDSKLDEDGINFMLAVVTGIEPRDQVEALLAAQMAAVHNAVMTFARRLANVEIIPQQDSAERAFNKLARIFAAQVEALKRYRTGGEQTVRVEHVTVQAGGQAIVGNVTGGTGGKIKSKEQPDALHLTHAPGQTLPSDIQAHKETVPVTGG
jgi:hypothetical protein